MQTFEVRRASASEAESVHRVMAEAYAEYRRLDVPSGALEETVDYVRRLLAEGQEDGALCLTAEGEVVGSVRFLASGEGLYFRRLGVVPGWRGQGAARAMLGWLEETARQERYPFIWCKVRAALPQNIRLYASSGYEVFEEQEVAKDDGRTVRVVSMRKPLGPAYGR